MLGKEVGGSEIEEATSEEKLERAKALVFEDAIPGIEAAKRAGMNGKRRRLETGPFSLIHDSSSCMGGR